VNIDRCSHAHVQLSTPIDEEPASRLEIARHKVGRKLYSVAKHDIGRLKVHIDGTTVDNNLRGVLRGPYRQPGRCVGVRYVTVADGNKSRE
jgi:hypothetical protein